MLLEFIFMIGYSTNLSYYKKANLGLLFFSLFGDEGREEAGGGWGGFSGFYYILKNTLPYDYQQEWPAWVVGVLGSGYEWAVRSDNWVAGKKGWVWRSRDLQVCFWEQVGMIQ